MKHDDANAGPGSPGSMPRGVGGAGGGGAGGGGESGHGERTGLAALFVRFLRFGCLAWGGPTAQIEMLRRELVEEEGWIDAARFKRVLAVYQALPGPEAFELCCYFGHLKRGRLGATAAGLGFLLPGLALMLIASWLLTQGPLTDARLHDVFWFVGLAVAGLIVNAAFKLWKHVVTAPWLVGCALACAVAQSWGVPFWISLGGCAAAGLARSLARTERHATWSAWVVIGVMMIAAGAWTRGGPGFVPSAARAADSALQAGAGTSAVPVDVLAAAGLKSGFLTFGGAYTAIPVVSADLGPLLPQGTIERSLAVGAVLPAPLVIFATMVGFVGGGWAGALVMTGGIFVPALGFTLIGHRHLDRLAANPSWHAPLDAVAAGVVGMLGLYAFHASFNAAQFGGLPVLLISWALAHFVKSRWITPVIVLGAASVAIGARVV